ncbi:MAG: DUF2793 domain-containing protein [Pseudomonadota bacterium]
MADTPRFQLPLVAPSQAQKHVTVNEALTRIDALAQLVLASTTEAVPPSQPAEGAVYSVPDGAVNDWSGETGRLAIAIGGGWSFADPAVGWTAYIVDEAREAVWDGSGWSGSGASPSGAGMVLRSIEIDHEVGSGPQSVTAAFIPANSLVFAVTGRVTDAIGGATDFSLGVDGGSVDRYGSGIGVAQGSYLRGLTSAPLAYDSATGLTLTAGGGDFDGGVLRLVAHIAEFTLPDA